MNSNVPIVVGVDGSAFSEDALRWAVDEASMRKVPLRIVHALFTPIDFGPSIGVGTDDFTRLEVDARDLLSEAARTAKAIAPEIDVVTELLHGPRVPALISESKEAGMIVVGSRGLGAVRRSLVGSVSSALARHAHAPVAVIRKTLADPWDVPRRRRAVLVGVDGTRTSIPAIEIAFDEAARRNWKLIALHARRDDSDLGLFGSGTAGMEAAEAANLAESLAGFTEDYPDVTVERVVVANRPFQHLLVYADNAGLVIVGSHGRGGFAGLTLGSVSQALLHALRCPLVIARS